MAKYLYGAAVQGIQGFILETNKLREIAGGSEFVEEICTTRFKKVLGKQPNNLIQGAAGIIRYLFDEEEKDALEKVVRCFPFEIQKEAPGITISQAVITVEGELHPKHISKLIQKLDAQRNNVQLSFLTAPMIAERSRNNGQAAVHKESGNEFWSQQQKLKRKLAENDTLAEKIGLPKKSLPMGDLDDISGTGAHKDQWLAVIHADGNSLGKLILNANRVLQESGKDIKAFYRSFSEVLDKATTQAAELAARETLSFEIQEWEKTPEDYKIPIRPVLLGGDDLTVIIKAQHALEFSGKFIAEFERCSKELVYKSVLKPLGGFEEFSNGLTTCVGIAYIKPNYPFHYAENLAQQLCKAAKKVSKKLDANCAPSSLMFHQVQSSFVGQWEEVIQRELTVQDGSFVGGPYFQQEQVGYNTIAQLGGWSAALNETAKDGERNSLKSQIRALITEYIDNPAGAAQYEKRLRQLNDKSQFDKVGILGESIFSTSGNAAPSSHAWDIIKLATIQQKKDHQK